MRLKIHFLVVVIATLCFATLPLLAAETDIEVGSQRHWQFVSQELSIIEKSKLLRAEHDQIMELMHYLKVAFMDGDNPRVQNIITALAAKLVQVASYMEDQKAEIELYRVALFRHLIMQKKHGGEEASILDEANDEEVFLYYKQLYDRLSEEGKASIGPILEGIMKDRQDEKRIDEIIDRLSDVGLEGKHRDAYWRLGKLEAYKKKYAKVEIIMREIIKRLSNPPSNRSKNNFDQIIKDLDAILEMKEIFIENL